MPRSGLEIRPLLAERGCMIEDGIRLRTVPLTALMDATEIWVRRP
jgi:hypothetical protein